MTEHLLVHVVATELLRFGSVSASLLKRFRAPEARSSKALGFGVSVIAFSEAAPSQQRPSQRPGVTTNKADYLVEIAKHRHDWA